MSESTYRIIDEIEPVGQRSFAFHPDLPFYGAMMLSPLWLALFAAANSWLLGHPRRRHHVAVGAAAVTAAWAICFIRMTWMPLWTWKYSVLAVHAVSFTLGYYMSEEQEWAAEMFEQGGGRVVGRGLTIAALNILGKILPSRRAGPLRP
jgi:hypothetical protein